LKPLSYLDKFCEWLEINEKSLQFILDQHRNKKYWIQKENNLWEFNGLSKYQEPLENNKNFESNFSNLFTSNDDLERGKPSKYITIGKGFP
jgi:predicted enzyme involved in methoxymalonyl-ACP biosynthesis